MSTRGMCLLVGASPWASRPGSVSPQYVERWAWASCSLPHPPLPWKVFDLPPSVLRCFAQEPVETEGAYKAAVDSFLQQQHVLGAEGAGDSPSLAQGEEQLSWPCTQDPQNPQSPDRPPTAAQTEALSRLFDSVKTLTAKEELLQALR